MDTPNSMADLYRSKAGCCHYCGRIGMQGEEWDDADLCPRCFYASKVLKWGDATEKREALRGVQERRRQEAQNLRFAVETLHAAGQWFQDRCLPLPEDIELRDRIARAVEALRKEGV